MSSLELHANRMDGDFKIIHFQSLSNPLCHCHFTHKHQTPFYCFSLATLSYNFFHDIFITTISSFYHNVSVFVNLKFKILHVKFTCININKHLSDPLIGTPPGLNLFLRFTAQTKKEYSNFSNFLLFLFPQTTIKVFTACLRLDIEYKTLGIQWDTTSKEVVAQLLRR